MAWSSQVYGDASYWSGLVAKANGNRNRGRRDTVTQTPSAAILNRSTVLSGRVSGAPEMLAAQPAIEFAESLPESSYKVSPKALDFFDPATDLSAQLVEVGRRCGELCMLSNRADATAQ